jgi:NADPH:quinone reductase
MYAYRVEQANGSFTWVDLPRPTLNKNSVLVRIQASGVNPLDTKIRAGAAAHAQHPLPAVLGLDMAGVVEDIGSHVTKFKPGDEVYGMVGGVGGLQGTLAELIAADADLLALKPKRLSMREAAALPLVAITAWEGLVDRAKMHAGHTVLVHAGAGGVGNVAIQLAHTFGAKVFSTVSSEKRKTVEALGVTPIDYRSSTVEDYVATYGAGEGFDVVYDTVGGATLDASFVAAKRYTGHVVSCLGWGTHSLAPLSFRSASYSGVFTLFPLLSGAGRGHHGEILAQVASLVDEGRLRPLLYQQELHLQDIGAAYALVASGVLGKVVVEL